MRLTDPLRGRERRPSYPHLPDGGRPALPPGPTPEPASFSPPLSPSAEEKEREEREKERERERERERGGQHCVLLSEIQL